MNDSFYQIGFYISTSIAVVEGYFLVVFKNHISRLEHAVMDLSKRIDLLEQKST